MGIRKSRVLIYLLATAAFFASMDIASARSGAPMVAQAQVLSINAIIGHSSYVAQGGVDAVRLTIENVTRSKYVAVTLLPFHNYRLDCCATVMKISVPTTYVPKPNNTQYPYWLFQLRKGQTEKVVFTIRHVGDNSYCIGGSYYQTAIGRYTLCSHMR